ncbi:hypothetical protein ACFXKI_25865 [Streptomyces mirabilis]|uniref:hypothetical protein n=1 Tax=Streptomyces mirabilis TaxID=68239 RepID=UPI00369F537F
MRSTVPPPLLTIQQGQAARRLLSHIASLRLADADAQLLATVIAVRAARAGSGNITGQDLDFLRLGDTPTAVAELASLGWQFAGDLLDGDRETPVAVTVPGLADALPISRTARSRVSGWTTRTLASKTVKKASPSARLAALFLAESLVDRAVATALPHRVKRVRLHTAAADERCGQGH